MRDIIGVIDRITAELPSPQENPLGGLRAKLVCLKDSSVYMAPETAHLTWEKLARLLDSDLGTPDTPWKQKIRDIMRDEETTTHEVLP